jgi:membrane fusion protein (multidrug efflux system)
MNTPASDIPAADHSSAGGSSPPPASRARLLGFVTLGVAVLIGAIAWLCYYLLVARHYQSTDDAYVASDLVQITSEEPGTVIAVGVDDTQSVQRGDVLAELDPADAQLTIDAAQAQLARAVRTVRGLFAQRAQLAAQIAQHEADLQRAQSDLARREKLTSDGAVSGEELSHARDAVTVAAAALDAARSQLGATDAQIDGTTIETHPQVLDAESAVRSAALAVHRTQLRAPVAGVIAKRAVQLGQRVAPGAPLMAVVPLEGVWVDANFKEVQLRDMRVGQPVALHADVYGGKVTFHGRLVGLSAGSGSAFALLPAQNASGNWIKIVQRVPVRIALDPQELAAHPLRVGLSMKAEVDIRDSGGAPMSSQVRSTPRPTQASAADDPGVEALIQRIVTQNAGHPTPLALARAGHAGTSHPAAR